MLTRENFTGRAWRRNARSRRTTAGTLMIKLTEWTSRSYSSSTSTLPRNKRLIARCHEITLMGSKPWFSRRVCAESIDEDGKTALALECSIASAPSDIPGANQGSRAHSPGRPEVEFENDFQIWYRSKDAEVARRDSAG